VQCSKFDPIALRLSLVFSHTNCSVYSSETKRTYNHFDVPHEEQDIITAEERQSPPKARSIQDVMKNVCVYVEVRTGEDNRTVGIQKIIAALGARVHERIQKSASVVLGFFNGICFIFSLSLQDYNPRHFQGWPMVQLFKGQTIEHSNCLHPMD
jgi:hypothetical protein